MHAAPHAPIRGNRIWLATGLLAVTVLVATALQFAGTGCRPAAGSPTAAPGTAAAASARGTGTAGTGGGTVRVGTAVYYQPGSVVGSCLLGPFRAGGAYVSLPPAQYRGGAVCGSYLDVTGPAGTVRVEVVDLCPGCAPATINLSEAAFNKIASPGPGSARVTYRQAGDPPLRGPIRVRVAARSASGLFALQILRHGNPLTSVSVGPPGVTSAWPDWQRLALASDGYWVGHAAVGTGPVALRITDNLGHRVILTRIDLQPGTTVQTRTWMYRGTSRGPVVPVTAQPSPAATRPTASAAAASGGGTC